MRINFIYADIINHFLVYGDFIKAELFGNRHINDTFLVTFNQAGLPVRYILRKINKYVFKNPEIEVYNMINVIGHISKKLIETHEKDTSKVVMQINLFEAIVKEYLKYLAPFLTKSEISNLVCGAELIIYEQAIRFFTDYSNSDLYYHIDYGSSNIVRTRNQLASLENVICGKKTMNEIVRNYSGGDFIN